MRQGCFRSAGCRSSGFGRRANLLKSYFSGFRPAEMRFFRRKNRFLLREVSRTFDSASPARSSFTTFCHQKVAPKVSAGRKSRGTADGLRLKRYADELAPAFSTAHPPPVLLPAFSQCGTIVRCAQLRLFVCVRTWQIYGLRECTAKIADEVTASARAPGAGVQNSGVFCARSASTGVVTRYFSRCLIFRCFWIKPKAQGKEF